jgi:cyclic pyranopterin phosphate synthase
MPAAGIRFLPRHDILTFEEMERLVALLVGMGIEKVRVTGGEPFVRRGLLHFLRSLRAIPGLESLHVTTNGVLVAPLVSELKELGIAGINLSLETLSREGFIRITRRDLFDDVLRTLHEVVSASIPLKVNAVIQGGVNTDAIVPLARLAEFLPIQVRFIEEMPFNGRADVETKWDAGRILADLRAAYPQIRRVDERSSTASVYEIPGFAGTVGIIGGHSRTFCGSCSRVRITPAGKLRTCLYGDGVLDLRQLLRSGAGDRELATAIQARVLGRARDGFEAEAGSALGSSYSMATIGG